MYKPLYPCEPQLSSRGLYPKISNTFTHKKIETMMNIIAYLDGSKDIVEVANTINADALECISIVKELLNAGVIIKV